MPGERMDIDGQAAAWLERMDRPLHDSATAAAFDRWIAADPRHVESYGRMAALWRSGGLERALQTRLARNDNETGRDEAHMLRRDRESAEGAPRHHAGRTLRRRAGLVAVVALLAAALPLVPVLLAPAASYEAPPGSARTVALADGSRIHLGAGSRVTARLTPWSRRVTLQRGEAFFDVAHERLRAFSVETGDATVNVLGTAFDIDMLADGQREVRVYRGLVQVAARQGEWRLPAGSGLVLAGSRVRSLDDVEGQRPDWMDGWLDAQDTSLARVLERLNRTTDHPVVLADPTLGSLRVTGRFRMDAPEELLETLRAIYDVSWTDDGHRYTITR